VAFFSSAPEQVLPLLQEHLEQAHGAEVVRASPNLARRDALREDLEDVDADAYLVEIKAAAIDVVAEAAAERGIEVVFCDNELLPLPGEPDLDAELHALADAAAREPVAS
jgi:cyclic 2,3-diphosphoglycerate synthetase